MTLLAHGPLGGTAARRGRKRLDVDFPLLAAMAKHRGVSVQQLVLAWLVQRYPGTVVPIPGARSVEHVIDSTAAATITLSKAEMDQIAGLRLRRK
mmetsp:Transcript_50635/g.110092  ORF Transcript_50635/g.110092 Transcript_50635/m.110092 type:complete len:95 (+) Transcript_50635:341-625(+)